MKALLKDLKDFVFLHASLRETISKVEGKAGQMCQLRKKLTYE